MNSSTDLVEIVNQIQDKVKLHVENFQNCYTVKWIFPFLQYDCCGCHNATDFTNQGLSQAPCTVCWYY